MAGHGTAFVVGAGGGLGEALCRRFAKAGMRVGAARRDAKALAPLIQELTGMGVEAKAYAVDATNEASVEQAFAALEKGLGAPDLVVYNVGSFEVASLLDIEPEVFEDCWRKLCYGAFLVGKAAACRMAARGSGSILFTGATAALRGGARFANFAVGKFGERALAQCMAREFGPKGVHVAHFVLDGMIGESGGSGETSLDPDDIAEAFYEIHLQPQSAWTLELDLRPAAEKF